MNVQPVVSNELTVESRDFRVRMAEVLDLRDRVEALEKLRVRNRQRTEVAEDLHVERKSPDKVVSAQ